MGACPTHEVGGFAAAFSCNESGSFTAPKAEAWVYTKPLSGLF
jgi:hypothetical protein